MNETTKGGTAAVVQSPGGEVLGVFLLWPGGISEQDKNGIYDLAEKYNQSVTFVPVDGFVQAAGGDGVQAICTGIKQLNGED